MQCLLAVTALTWFGFCCFLRQTTTAGDHVPIMVKPHVLIELFFEPSPSVFYIPILFKGDLPGSF